MLLLTTTSTYTNLTCIYKYTTSTIYTYRKERYEPKKHTVTYLHGHTGVFSIPVSSGLNPVGNAGSVQRAVYRKLVVYASSF